MPRAIPARPLTPQPPQRRQLSLPLGPTATLPDLPDRDLDELAARLGITLDSERRAVLKHRGSADVRACPGSGKTTLLVAKLALLARRWERRCQGIAVISHTNVAHREIRSRFAAMPALRDLEQYPHFIGTIQSFLQMTLGAAGAILAFGTRPAVIDDDACLQRVERLLALPRFTAARGYLARGANRRETMLRSLRFTCGPGGTLTVTADGLPREGTATAQALTTIKRTLAREGVLRYCDMNATARHLMILRPDCLHAVRHRFPVVLMDEAQDTDAEQDAILREAFSPCIVQRFGDDRQAIFADLGLSDEGSFPGDGFLSMTNSMRLSPSIARLVSNVCLVEPESLGGNARYPDLQHTIFLFAPGAHNRVLPAFAELAATQLGSDLASCRIKAVGSRRSAPESTTDSPSSLVEYWPALAYVRSRSDSLKVLADHLGAARHDALRTGTTAPARDQLLHACCQILRLQGVLSDGRPYTPSRLLHALSAVPGADHTFATSLAALIRDLVRPTPPPLSTAAAVLQQHLAALVNAPWNSAAIGFCSTPASSVAPASLPDAPPQALFVQETAQGRVAITVDTIHSVKGETLDAVLVLETSFRRIPDLSRLVQDGLLRGQRPRRPAALAHAVQEHTKRVFVAMSRPTKLLCLAMRADRVSAEHQGELELLGWRLHPIGRD